MVYSNAKDSTFELVEINALPLEHKRNNWYPRRQAKIDDFIGDTAIKRFISPDMSHVEKHLIQVLDAQKKLCTSVLNHYFFYSKAGNSYIGNVPNYIRNAKSLYSQDPHTE